MSICMESKYRIVYKLGIIPFKIVEFCQTFDAAKAACARRQSAMGVDVRIEEKTGNQWHAMAECKEYEK